MLKYSFGASFLPHGGVRDGSLPMAVHLSYLSFLEWFRYRDTSVGWLATRSLFTVPDLNQLSTHECARSWGVEVSQYTEGA